MIIYVLFHLLISLAGEDVCSAWFWNHFFALSKSACGGLVRRVRHFVQPWPSRSYLTLKSEFTPFWACPHHNSYPFKLGSQNFGQRCKVASLRFLLFWVAFDLDLQGHIWLKKWNFLVSPLLEIHNHHITTREPWVPGLLHRSDCFMVSILCAYLYI